MRIDPSSRRLGFLGEANPVADAVVEALTQDGFLRVALAEAAPDVLVASAPLLPRSPVDTEDLIAQTSQVGDRMAQGEHGRIVVLMSAMGVLPMRRHPVFSMQSAALLAGTRALAMRLGPKLLVNAIGTGLIGDPPVSGDPAMRDHTAQGRAGTLQEVIAAARLLCNPRSTYLTGQILLVDGGWSTGYARNF